MSQTKITPRSAKSNGKQSTGRSGSRGSSRGSGSPMTTVQDEMELDETMRPGSSSSKHAWDTGLDNPGVEAEDYDHAPTAMESEMYVDGSMKIMDNRTKQSLEDDEKGTLFKIGRAVRSLWRTRQTDNTKEDRELHIKTTLRELFIYLVFIIILCIVTFGMTSTTMYYYTKVMSELFLDSQFEDTKNTFRGMTTMQDFWRFAQGPLISGLYWVTWYNGVNLTEEDLGYIYYENKLLGLPRMRQVKVRNDSCTVHDHFKDSITTCYDNYAEGIEETNPYGLNNGTAWTYSTEDALDGSSYWGTISTYSGSGYYEDMSLQKLVAEAQIAELKENLWVDRGTRAVFVDFTVYNANINLFCVIRLVIEFPATGGVIPSWVFRTVKLLRYVTTFDYIIMACEGLFCLFVLYYIIEEAIEIYVNRLAYFKSVWNLLDILVIGLSVCSLAFNVYRSLSIGEMLTDLLDNPDMYANFEFLSFAEQQYNNMLACLVFFAWIKVFKYISFNKTMTQLSSTLSRCGKDLGGFTVMFLIVFLAYAQLGYLVFGTQVSDFKSIGDAIFTLFRIILGDFNFHELEQANRILGPIFFVTYVFFVFFVLLNMFLAIINDTYSEVKADISSQKSEFEITDYFKKGYEKMLGKLNFKRDKIVDIQNALAHGDSNNDQQLDYDEWRSELKARGHADAEIEAMFSKYDQDGDRMLDAEEQAKMASDLQEQKAELTTEIAEVEAAKDVGGSKADFRQMEGGEEGKGSGSGGGGGGGGVGGVTYEEFVVLSRRVDRMEHSIGSIVSKIDAVLVKLEAMERAKMKRRETMGKLLDSITEEQSAKGRGTKAFRGGSRSSQSFYESDSEYSTDEDDKGKSGENMEQMVREELERYDSSGGSQRRLNRSGTSQSIRSDSMVVPNVPDPSTMTTSNV